MIQPLLQQLRGPLSSHQDGLQPRSGKRHEESTSRIQVQLFKVNLGNDNSVGGLALEPKKGINHKLPIGPNRCAVRIKIFLTLSSQANACQMFGASLLDQEA
jgi:hypothetical protein